MKNKIFLIIIISFTFLTACTDLDLNPLSEGSSANWYSNESEINMSLNDLYRQFAWKSDGDRVSDDWQERATVHPIAAGTVNSEWGTASSWWLDTYKVIARTNSLLENLENAEGNISADKINQYKGDASFVRANKYTFLVTHWGDVPLVTGTIDVEEAFTMGRTDINTIKELIYSDFDFAIQNLPVTYSGTELRRATKGAALAMKARAALYLGDYSIAREAARDCMGLDVYSLHSNYGDLFLTKTKNSSETIFALPRSLELGVALGGNYPQKAMICRNAGGWGVYNPSWELFSAYSCTDGLPIDESLLFDPQEPFKNRDPRCTMTIVEHDTEHLNFIFDPNPYSTTTLKISTGTQVRNNDSRIITPYAPYNGMLWRKGIDVYWDDLQADPDKIIMRYADVLLMYAEASVETDQIDQTVLDAVNEVRERAYNGTGISYPPITTTNQNELRRIVRNERRVELAMEGLRFMDLIRWRLAEKVLVKNIYGTLDPAEQKEKLVDAGLYFWPYAPEIDEDGIANFDPMYSDGYIKLLATQNFDKNKGYLFPIPSKERLVNENLTQNPGY